MHAPSKTIAAVLLSTLLLCGCYSGVPFQEGSIDMGEVPSEDADPSSSPPDPPSPQVPADFNCTQEATWTVDFLSENCGDCHGSGSTGEGGLDEIENFEALLEGGLLVAGSAEGSPLFARLESGNMPPEDIDKRPSVLEIARTQRFIDECLAPLPGECDPITPHDNGEMLARLATDAVTIDADDRPFVRYLSLAHLGASGFCDEEVEYYRSAVSKALNSLSTEVSIRNPVAIDQEKLLFRIDLRDYGWDKEDEGFGGDRWEAIADASPYSVRFLDDNGEFLQTLTGSPTPVLMADAVLDVALLPPLYHRLTEAPATLQGLESRLGIDIDENIDGGEAPRAGLLDSAFATQNRVVERHQLAGNAAQSLWLAYDFADAADPRQNIFVSPLAFEASLHEVLYTLPNGAHAYLLFDAQGQRVDEGGDAIATDPLQPDRVLRPGISCIGCHTAVHPAQDVVRAHALGGVEFDAQQKDAIESLYLSPPSFDTLTTQDSAALQQALTNSGVDVSAPIEPVSYAYAGFQRDVDLTRAAAELGISRDALYTNLGRLSPVLAPLAGGSVKRDTWAALFAETVCLLNVGDAPDEACETNADDQPGTSGTSGGEDDSSGGSAPQGEAVPYGPCPPDGCGPEMRCLGPSGQGICAPVGCHADGDCPAADLPGPVDLDCRPVAGEQTRVCVVDCRDDGSCPGQLSCLNNSFCGS